MKVLGKGHQCDGIRLEVGGTDPEARKEKSARESPQPMRPIDASTVVALVTVEKMTNFLL